MYIVQKTFEISAAHKLDLSYRSKCANLHGHNWIVTVVCASSTLNDDGMVLDFNYIKKTILDKLDHAYINDVIGCNPTAENIARWIARQIGESCVKVTVKESEGNVAIYEI